MVVHFPQEVTNLVTRGYVEPSDRAETNAEVVSGRASELYRLRSDGRRSWGARCLQGHSSFTLIVPMDLGATELRNSFSSPSAVTRITGRLPRPTVLLSI